MPFFFFFSVYARSSTPCTCLNAAWRMYFHSCQGDGRRGEFLPANNRPAGSGGDAGARLCVAVEEGLEGAGNFVPSQELLSLSLGHTWFHQSARPSFIIDANQFRAD